ncbi:MAG: hypothetical protein ACPGYV_10105, partial [Phycisphaeraceae bacterium]
MGKRFVVVGGATAVAGLVLGAAIVLGPPAAQNNRPDLPSDIDAPGVVGPDGTAPGVDIQQFDYTTFEVGSDGQLRGTRLRAEQTNLKSLGITNLVKPNAEIRLGSQRAITITADQADMEMEDSRPRAGVFSGNVVVTLAQAPEGVELVLDQDNPEHLRFIQQRIYLDDATNFSIEDDTISTPGPVHVTGHQVDFFGIGLRLAYNTQRERIEQLLINEGRYLIVNPDAQPPAFEADDDEDQANPDEPEAEAEPTDEPTAPDAVAEFQFYKATFLEAVVVRDGVESELAGDSLSIDFSLGTPAVEVAPIAPETAGRLPRVIPTGRLAQANEPINEQHQDGTDPVLPVVQIPEKNAQRSLLTHDPKRDIVVTWTGSLAVTPYAQRPEPLADEEDAHLTLTGKNAYAQTVRNGELERLEAGKLQYLVSQARTAAVATTETPLRIVSAALGGEITGQQLIVNQSRAAASVLGPGQLTYTNQDDGKALDLTWQNRLDLELYPEDPAPKPNEQAQPTNEDNDTPTTRIAGVKTATFDGNVTARHTDFDLDSDTLTIAFAEPDPQNNIDNTPTAINAAGSVAVKARGDADDETFDIAAGRLSIDLALDRDNEPYASAIRALDQVRVQRPGSTLTCDRVSVELCPPSQATPQIAGAKPEPADPVNEQNALADADADARTDADATASTNASEPNAPAPTPPKERFAEVRSILAVGTVRANLDYDDRRVDLVADQLIADVENDRLTLAADPDRPLAEITDLSSGRKLTGKLVVMDDQAEQLDITGPGTLATVLSDPGNPDATIDQAFLAIAWQRAMSFNNVTGEAEFFQGVRSESRRSTDASELTCDALTMRFSPDYQHDPNRLFDDDGKDQHERQIRSANARGSVKFTAWAYDLNDPERITNRIRLEGPQVQVTNQPATEIGKRPVETLVVPGPGRMVLEDYRNPKPNNKDDKASMTGRGATLFNWNQSMTLDARANTATLLEDVTMTHLPKDENDT